VSKLAAEVEAEKVHLEDKIGAIGAAKRNSAPKDLAVPGPAPGPRGAGKSSATRASKRPNLAKTEGGFGFSSGLVREVYRLSDEKVGVGEIVQRTKLSRAEIQLILNLRGNGFTTPN